MRPIIKGKGRSFYVEELPPGALPRYTDDGYYIDSASERDIKLSEKEIAAIFQKTILRMNTVKGLFRKILLGQLCRKYERYN